MLVKTSNLTDAALNYAVAIADGHTARVSPGGLAVIIASGGYMPAHSWYLGGPIIERERIDLVWQASGDPDDRCAQRGPTPLIAAMRCFVAAKLGNEVDIPEEFMQ